ncbi:MAG: alkaline shock response membrane anchor protein AmaP [Actinomycetota bacterium]|nr:alkaline shock response membrane anchor protein AmaP [Actinomycetota bacterium]
MYRRTTRGNRTGLTIVGLLLVLAGAAMVTVHFGVFGAAPEHQKLYPQPADTWVTNHHWIYWAAAVLALIIALLVLRWLLVQTRTDRVHRLIMDSERQPETGSGTTSLSAGALADVVIADATAITGVRSASANLTGPPDAPELWLKVTVDDNADTGVIRTRLFDGVLADVRQALEMPDLPTYLTIVVNKRTTARQVS